MSLSSNAHFSITLKVQSSLSSFECRWCVLFLTLFKVSFLDNLALAFNRDHLISPKMANSYYLIGTNRRTLASILRYWIFFIENTLIPNRNSIKWVVTIATVASFLIVTKYTYIMAFSIGFYVVWRNEEISGPTFLQFIMAFWTNLWHIFSKKMTSM